MSQVAVREIAGQLLLARLLVAEKKPLTRANLQKALAPLSSLLRADQIAALFERTVTQLEEDGLLSSSPVLTETGRARALEFWQIDRLPPRIRWEALQRDYLVPRLLGINLANVIEKDRPKAVLAGVVKTLHDLPEDVASDPQSVIHALAWRQLGIESTARFTPEAVVARTLLDSEKKTTAGDLTRQLAERGLESSGRDLVPAALKRWLEGVDQTRSTASSKTGSAPGLDNFASTALSAARSNSTGRFGTNKVFISHVWNALRRDPQHADLPLPKFKQRLLDAHRQGLLELSRADLVERMPADDLASSETHYFDATFHFVCLK